MGFRLFFFFLTVTISGIEIDSCVVISPQHQAGFLMIVLQQTSSEYYWTGKEWVWKDVPKNLNNEDGSGDFDDHDDEDRAYYERTTEIVKNIPPRNKLYQHSSFF